MTFDWLIPIAQVAVGAAIAISFAVWLENLRKPKLEIKIGQPKDMEYADRPAKQARFLDLEVVNKPLPRWARWTSRNAAFQCHGTITFCHLDGQNIFGRSMPIKWSAGPEPATNVAVDGQKVSILDSDVIRYLQGTGRLPAMDVSPGEAVSFNVAARFDDDSECYGWSYESYVSIPIWRNPHWKLPQGRYLVKATIFSAGEKCTGIFRLVNEGLRGDFRLQSPLNGDENKVRD